MSAQQHQHQHPRIGDILRRIVGLSGHDVDEILQEQATTHKRFGEIALSLGLCQPEHIWAAWSHQLRTQRQRVRLSETGIDTQAIPHICHELARKYHAVPIRSYEQRLIVAVTEPWHEIAISELPRLLTKKDVCFVLADRDEIERALADHYPPLQKTA